MSIEYYAALNKSDLRDGARLNEVVREMGIPIEDASTFSDLSSFGFRPAIFAGEKSGVEAGIVSLDEVAGQDNVFDAATTGRCDSVVIVTFGSDPREGAVAMGVCAALTRASGALVYSTDDGRFVEEAELMGWMHELAGVAQGSEARR